MFFSVRQRLAPTDFVITLTQVRIWGVPAGSSPRAPQAPATLSFSLNLKFAGANMEERRCLRRHGRRFLRSSCRLSATMPSANPGALDDEADDDSEELEIIEDEPHEL